MGTWCASVPGGVGFARPRRAGTTHGEQRRYSALVAADGTFRIENVEPGSYELRFGVPHIRIGGEGRVWTTLSGQGSAVLLTCPRSQPGAPRSRSTWEVSS